MSQEKETDVTSERSDTEREAEKARKAEEQDALLAKCAQERRDKQKSTGCAALLLKGCADGTADVLSRCNFKNPCGNTLPLMYSGGKYQSSNNAGNLIPAGSASSTSLDRNVISWGINNGDRFPNAHADQKPAVL